MTTQIPNIETSSTEALIRWAHDMNDGPLAEIAERLEEAPLVDADWRFLVECGAFNLVLPVELGGRGMSMSDYLPVLATFARGHGGTRMIIHMANSSWKPLVRYGTAEQRDRYLAGYPDAGVVCFSLTEPDAGSGEDVKTTARRDGDGFVVTGRKHWATLADRARVLLVVCRTEDEHGNDLGITTLLIEPDSPGVTMVPMPPTMGARGVEHCVIDFERCRVGPEAVLGEVGQGLEVAFEGFLDASRLSIATSCLGLAEAALDEALAFAPERVTFGRPIATRQGIQALLADAGVAVHALRLMVLDTARAYDEGRSIRREAAMSKLLGIRTVTEATDNAIQVFGGLGYSKSSPIERMYRDARALWFEEGTVHIQQAVVARSLLEG